MSRFPPHILDDIRNRLTLSEIVGRRVSFDRRKSQPQKGDFWGCCPFHNEKTPSFHVDDRKGIYHCFGCGVTGDHFRFLTEKEGLSFPEAVERLADEAGIALPKADPRMAEQDKRRASLYDVMALVQQFFLEQLQGKDGAAARGYLQQRGLTLETQRRFGIGFAPRERSALKQFLAARGVGHEQMAEAGLLVAGPDIPVSYDKFRDRIMFPILDLKERVIAFGGRAMSADNPAKYMNSPETPLFSKRTVLYNAANARKAAYERGRIVAVEGYMDVIALAQAGIREAVAPLGTALTGEQLQLLWKMADEPILCFDGDEAGMRAASRSIDVALPLLKPGKTTRFAVLPDGRDPDDLIRMDGAEAMEEVLGQARALSDMLWAREAETGVYDTPERRAALEAKFSTLTATILDSNVRRHYEQAFRERMQAFFAPEGARRGGGYGGREQNAGGRFRSFPPSGNYRSTGRHGHAGGSGMGGVSHRLALSPVSEQLRKNALTSRNYDRTSAPPIPRELVLVIAPLNHPALLADYLEDFAALFFRNAGLQRMQSALIECYSQNHGLAAAEFREQLASKGYKDEIARLEAALSSLPLWQIGLEASDSAAECIWKQALALHRRAHTLNKELKAAERAYANDESELNLERLLDVNAQIANLDGANILNDELDAVSGL